MDQTTIDRAVNIATREALAGRPVKRIVWLPPICASSDPRGTFAVQTCEPLSGSETPPWVG